MALIVGLTGGIGCGKSSACDLFAGLGVDVIDTDQISRQLTAPGGGAVAAIRQQFGDDYITTEGALDRRKMRELVFTDRSWRDKLERLLHPRILAETAQRIAQSQSIYAIVAIPLLFETGDYDHLIDRVLVIDCDEALQLARTMARSGLGHDEVRTIMAAQVSRCQRLEKADDVIINNSDLSNLKRQVVQIHQKYINLSGQLVSGRDTSRDG